MLQDTYKLLEDYMLSCMHDSAHDKEHIYRVLYNALQIAETEKDVDYEVLICACLLHDIGRGEQYENPNLCHAKVGSEKAYRFLIEKGFEEDYARKVEACILAHRFRKDQQPQSLEAKILFDADKLDVTGAIGVARTLLYQGIVSEPLYTVGEDGQISNGEADTEPSFFQEYKYKLEKLYTKFYTAKACEMAESRRKIAADFYQSLYDEVNSVYAYGREELEKRVE